MPFKKAIVSIILPNAFQKRQCVYYFAECLLKKIFLLYCWILFKKEIVFFTLLNAFQKDNCVLWSNGFKKYLFFFRSIQKTLFSSCHWLAFYKAFISVPFDKAQGFVLLNSFSNTFASFSAFQIGNCVYFYKYWLQESSSSWS